MKYTSIFIVLILSEYAGMLLAEDTPQHTNIMEFLDSAKTTSTKEFNSSFESVYVHKKTIVLKMIQLLKDENIDSKKKEALCYLLGEYRDRESIPVLMEIISLENDIDPSVYDTRMPLWFEYPAKEALVKIGKESVTKAIEKLKTENNEKIIKLLSDVIKGVEGKKIGQIVLQDAVDAEKDPDKKKRLENALAYFGDQTKQANQSPSSSIANLSTPNANALPVPKTASEQFGATNIILVVVAFLLLADVIIRLRKGVKR